MKKIIERMENSFSKMTESHKKAAQYIMGNLEQIAFYTLDELANKTGVSTATIIRFVRNLGYRGYSEFLEDVQKAIKAKVGLPERLSVSLDNNRHDQLLLDSFNQDLANINDTLANLSPNKLNEVIDMIMSSHVVYIIGLRSSYTLAYYLATTLGQMRENVRLIQAVGSIYPEETLSATSNDLCIAFTFPRYARVTYEVVRWIKRQGARVISITDSLISPVAEFSDIVIPCETNGILFKSSLSAPLCLINYLVAAVAMEDKDEAMRVLSKTEELLSQGHYFKV